MPARPFHYSVFTEEGLATKSMIIAFKLHFKNLTNFFHGLTNQNLATE